MTEAFGGLDAIRNLAVRYGYTEVQFNENSRVVAFKSMDGTVRMNVYYTTGTVATCLSHPTKGKTQLFRRNQTAESLEVIFRNPRTHTGEGYYYHADGDSTQTNHHRWSPIKKRKNRGDDPSSRSSASCDDAQRWRYVQAATNFCSPQQASQIAAICELWNEIRFDRNGPSTLDVYNSFPEEVKRTIPSLCPQGCGHCGQDRAGSTCALASLLIQVARVTEGPEVRINDLMPSIDIIHDDSIPDEDKKKLPCVGFIECPCEEGLDFQQSLSNSIERFRRQLMSFPKSIRRELIYFFLKKVLHNYDLVVGTVEPLKGTIFVTTDKQDGKTINLAYYGSCYLSNDILSAHHDYGDLMYGDDDNKGGSCPCHGIRVAS